MLLKIKLTLQKSLLITILWLTILSTGLSHISGGNGEDITTNIYFIGDSISAGTGNDGQSYFHKLNDHGEPWTNEDLYMLNAAKPGRSVKNVTDGITNEGLDSASQLLQRYEPQFGSSDYVFIQLGSNDYLYQDPAEFSTVYNAMVEDLLEHLGDPSKLILFMFPWANLTSYNVQVWTPWTGEELDYNLVPDYQQVMIDAASENNIKLVDLWTPTIGHNEFFTSDGAHPNEIGHEFLAKIIHDEISSDIQISKKSDTEGSDFSIGYIIIGLTGLGVIRVKKMRNR